MENVEAFGVGLHQAVLDTVVDHLDKMAGAGRAAIKVALFDGAGGLFTSGCARNVPAAWRQCFEDGIEMAKSFLRSANHHAVATLQTPHAAAGSYVDIVDSLVAQGDSAARVIFEIRVAAIDDDVALVHATSQIGHRLFSCVACRHHDPNRAR